MSVLSKISKSFSGFNIGKLDFNFTKNVDVKDIDIKKIDTSIPNTNLNKIEVTDVNVTGDIASDLKKFESEPGATLLLSRTKDAISKNPKLAALGISGLAASGFIVSEMAKGKTFDEAFESLVELAEDTVEKTTGSTTSVVSGIVHAFLVGLFGEDYLSNFKKIGIVFTIVIFIFLIIKSYKFLKN